MTVFAVILMVVKFKDNHSICRQFIAYGILFKIPILSLCSYGLIAGISAAAKISLVTAKYGRVNSGAGYPTSKVIVFHRGKIKMEHQAILSIVRHPAKSNHIPLGITPVDSLESPGIPVQRV